MPESNDRREYHRLLKSELCNIPLHALDDHSRSKQILNFHKERCMIPDTTRVDPWSTDPVTFLSSPGAIHDQRANIAHQPRDKGRRFIDMENLDRYEPWDFSHLLEKKSRNLAVWGGGWTAISLGRHIRIVAEVLPKQRRYEIIFRDAISAMAPSKDGGEIVLAFHRNKRFSIIDVESANLMENPREGISHGSSHSGGILSVAWCQQRCVTTGGSDGMIVQHDLRTKSPIHQHRAHYHDVTSLKWSPDGMTLASGGNDGYICVFDAAMQRQRLALDKGHQRGSSIRAIDWCPFQPELLATGGMKDRNINLWDTSNGSLKSSRSTGAAVTALVWSQRYKELCSSHGYSKGNEASTSKFLRLWRYNGSSGLEPMEAWQGHWSTVSDLALNPNGSIIASVSMDSVVKFWDIFEPSKGNQKALHSQGLLSDLDSIPRSTDTPSKQWPLGTLNLHSAPTVR